MSSEFFSKFVAYFNTINKLKNVYEIKNLLSAMVDYSSNYFEREQLETTALYLCYSVLNNHAA